MSAKLLFFSLASTTVGSLLAFLVIGLQVNAEHWWHQRNRDA